MGEERKISGSNKHMVTMPDSCGNVSSANEVINLGALTCFNICGKHGWLGKIGATKIISARSSQSFCITRPIILKGGNA